VTAVDLTIHGEIEVLRLQPGDTIIVTLTDGHATAEIAERIKAQVKERFPNHDVIVADRVRFSVQREGPPPVPLAPDEEERGG
jgi:hypothetical protein